MSLSLDAIANQVPHVGDKTLWAPLKAQLGKLGASPMTLGAGLRARGCTVSGMYLVRTEPRTVEVTVDNVTFRAYADDHISKPLTAKPPRWYEYKLLDYTRTNNLVNDETVVVDLGAHIGNHTLFWSVVCGAKHVVAVEACPETHAWLSRNVSMQIGTWANVETICALVVPHADVGDPDAKYTLVTTPGNTGMNRWEEGGDIKVDTVSLVGLLEDLGRVGLDANLIKIDIEGSGPAIIEDPALDLYIDRDNGLNRPHFIIEAATADELDAIDAVLVERHGYRRNPKSLASTPTYHWEPTDNDNENDEDA